MKTLLLPLLIALLFCSCTKNQQVKSFGGTANINLPAGKKLVNVTWKDDDLWYIIRDRRPNEAIETYQFKEESSFGIAEGTYIISEQ